MELWIDDITTASTVLRANMHKFCMQDRLLPAVSLTEYNSTILILYIHITYQ